MINTENIATIINNDDMTFNGLRLFDFDNDKEHFIAQHFAETSKCIDKTTTLFGFRELHINNAITFGFDFNGNFHLGSAVNLINAVNNQISIDRWLAAKEYVFALDSVEDINNIARKVLAAYYDHCHKLIEHTKQLNGMRLYKLLQADDGAHIFFTPRDYIKYVYCHLHDFKPIYQYADCNFMSADLPFFAKLFLTDSELASDLNNNDFITLVLNTLKKSPSIVKENKETKVLLDLIKRSKAKLNKRNCKMLYNFLR